ncbi:MAG: hypothetical protein HOK82_17285 [Rhodospirillaceae bacterium]|jgi:hypothetical protein|nr:hypothetical protein [Rhodospirillaceae bacterium]
MPNTDPDEEELRALLKPRRAPPQRRVKGRWSIFTEKDCRAFTLALRERIPSVAFLFDKKRAVGDKFFEYFQVDGLEECANQPYAFANATVFVPETAQDAKRICSEPIPKGVSRLPPCSFRLILTTQKFQRTRSDGTTYQSIGVTNMYANYFPSDRDTANFLARVWRIAGKITHNRWDDIDVETGEILYENFPGRWCGFDALRWCQESKDRVLEDSHRTSADWSMPDSPYYD